MVTGYRKQIESITEQLDAKQLKRLKVDLLLRLVDKLAAYEDSYIESLFPPLLTHLSTTVRGDSPRPFRKQFSLIRKAVEKEFGLVPSGSVKEQYMGMWIGIGVAIGAGAGSALGNVAVGTGVWIAIGVAVGTQYGEKKEAEAAQKGILY